MTRRRGERSTACAAGAVTRRCPSAHFSADRPRGLTADAHKGGVRCARSIGGPLALSAMPQAQAPGPNTPAADADTSATSETVSEHPLADSSGSTQLSAGGAALSIPMTPSARRTPRTGSAPSPSHAPLTPRAVPSTSAAVPPRMHQIRYIRSDAAGSSVRAQHRTRAGDDCRHHERMNHLVVECSDAAAGVTCGLCHRRLPASSMRLWTRDLVALMARAYHRTRARQARTMRQPTAYERSACRRSTPTLCDRRRCHPKTT